MNVDEADKTKGLRRFNHSKAVDADSLKEAWMRPEQQPFETVRNCIFFFLDAPRFIFSPTGEWVNVGNPFVPFPCEKKAKALFVNLQMKLFSIIQFCLTRLQNKPV